MYKKFLEAGRPKKIVATNKKALIKNLIASTNEESENRKNKQAKTVRGMRDIIATSNEYWNWTNKTCVDIAEAYSFQEINTPLLEATALFKRAVGAGTDIVEKEMFSFEDQSGDKLSLRPEMTASIVRAYIEHGMLNMPQPVKLWQFGRCYRHERPQSGRFREFYQFDTEIIGEADPVVDAEIITVAYTSIAELGLQATIQVNSLGDPGSRGLYITELVSYFKANRKGLCEDCKKRLTKNSLRLLDCKEVKCADIAIDAPQITDHLDEESKKHFVRVLEYLDEFDLPYSLNPRLVRGLDYYNRTTFEIWSGPAEDGRQSALGGGGRYDYLVEQMGGRPTPACGSALGIDRIVARLRDGQCKPPEPASYKLYVAQLGEEARKKSLHLFEDLRKAGFRTAQNLSKTGLRQQLERANKLGVKYTLVLGQKEIMNGTVLLRDMESGNQEVLDYTKIILEIRKRLQ